jgi:glyoxylase-like metal-dependent hydrolase (beta-lactamase superfamily II)
VSSYTITPLLVGIFPSFEKSFFLQGTDYGVKIRAPCISWLVQAERGETLVVDTGPHAGDAPTSHLHNRLEVNPEHRVDRALQQHGVDPGEVSTVLFSHLHFDHCYHAEVFTNPKTRFLVQRADLQYAIAPIAWHRASFESGLPGIRPPWFNIFDRLEAVDGDIEVLPGIGFVALPGHTPGSAGVTVHTRRGTHLLAGDTISLLDNWEGSIRGQRHIPPGSLTDAIACYQSFQKIERLADVVLASHDFRMFDVSRYG